MNIWRLLTAAFRRWYVLIPLLLLSGLAAVSVRTWVEPEYQTTAVAAFIPSTAPIQVDPTKPQMQNPYSSVEYSALVISHVMNSSDTATELEARGLSTDYEVVVVESSSALIGIEVFARSPRQAIETGRALLDVADQELTDRQEAVHLRKSRYITMGVLDDPDTVEKSIDRQLQAMAAIMAVGGSFSVVLATVVDDLILLRRRRREQNQQTQVMTPMQSGEAPPQGEADHNGARRPAVHSTPSAGQRR